MTGLDTFKRIVQGFFSLDRSVFVIIVATLAMFLSVISPWYLVPDFDSPSHQWVNASISSIEMIARTIMLLMVLLVPYFCLRKSQVNHVIQRLSWLLLLLIALFPFYIFHWEPEQFITGTMLQEEIELVSSDMEDNMNNQQREWRYWQKLSFESYRGVSVGAKDGWSISFLYPTSFSKVSQIIFAYSNEFLNVVSRGWVFAGVGILLLLVGLSLRPKSTVIPYVPNRMFYFSSYMLVLFVSVFPRAVSEYKLQSADYLALKGNFSEAIKLYHSAADWKPSLKYSVNYYSGNLGELLSKQGCQNCFEVLMMKFSKNLSQHKLLQARDTLEMIERLYPDAKQVRLWISNVNNHLAIQAFNEGQYSIAANYWRESNRLMSVNPVSYYGIAMVNTKLKLFYEASESLEKVLSLQQYLTFKRMTIKGQLIVMQSWSAYKSKDHQSAFQIYSLGLTPEVW